MDHFPRSEGWTPLVDPTRSSVVRFVETAPKTERLELRYESESFLSKDSEKEIPGLFEAARPLPLRGLRLVNLYKTHSPTDDRYGDQFDIARAECDLTGVVLPELAAASWLSLDTLEISAARKGLLTDGALKKAACFEGLRRFVLSYYTALPAWLRLPEARELVLSNISYGGAKEIMPLVSSAPALELLWVDTEGREIVNALAGTALLPHILNRLGKSPFLPKLRSLALTNTLDEPATLLLAELDRPFEHLDLRYSWLGEKGALALANSPVIAQCGTLDLRNCEIPAAIAARFRERLGDRVKLDPPKAGAA